MVGNTNADDLFARYHAEPGKTVRLHERWRDDRSRTSYEVLVEAVEAIAPTGRVLDLACGDGYLLAMLERRGLRDLVGIDRSTHELAAARERLAPGVELVCDDARALSLRDRSVEVVTCHMALMLMDPIAPVLSEIARVLVPGGHLLAVVCRALQGPIWDSYRRQLQRITADAGLERLRLGDPRVLSAGGIREILTAHPEYREDVRIDDFRICETTSPRDLWSLLRLMYDVYRLPPAAITALEQRLISAWEHLVDADGRLTCPMEMRLLHLRT
jgi:SAM-dependent methyltransferase